MNLGSSIRRRRFGKRGSDHQGPGTSPRSIIETRGSKLVGLTALALLVGLGGGYLFATQMLFPAPPLPEGLLPTPDVRGLTLTEAHEEIQEAGLTVGEADSIRHPVAPQGQVLGQSPLPGQLSVPGAEVRLTFSMGPERRQVPDVVRFRAERAQTVLEATGFVVTLDSVESTEYRGTVVALDPAPGEEVALPGEVVVSVSLGPPLVAMPELIGLQEVDALAVLDSLGLNVPEVETRFRFGLDQGTVIEQEPAPETMVEQGSDVRVVVARRSGGNRNN